MSASAARPQTTVPGLADDDEPVAVFMRAMKEANALEKEDEEAKVAFLAAEVRSVYQEATVAALAPARLAELGARCRDLYALGASSTAHDAVLSLASGLGAKLAGSPGTVPGLADRLGQCALQVRLALTKALLDERNESYYELRKMVRDDYRITLELLDNAERDPRLLAWLANTQARAGILGLWSTTGPVSGMLDIAGTFCSSVGPDSEDQSSSRPAGMAVENFPPEELFGRGDEAPLVCVFPLKGPQVDWGFLAIAQPLVSALGQEAYFTWSALFSEALNKEEALKNKELLRSLRQRSEELDLSYRREKKMARAVRDSEERYALAVQATNDGLWDWDLTSGAFYLSPRLKEMLALGDDDVEASRRGWFGHAHPEDRPELLAEVSALVRGERSSIVCEHRARAESGAYRWVLCRALAVPGAGAPATRIVGSLTDVTDRHLLEERLRQQALYDSLTGLPNRGLFLDRLSQAMAAARRQPGCSYAVLWVDIDHFKAVNDTFGHLYGDELLVQVAGRITAQVRGADTAARFGGDEFVVLLEDLDGPASAEAVVRRLSERLNQPYQLKGQEVPATASIGVAIGCSSYETPDEVLRDANAAMYSAKSARRGTYFTFEVGGLRHDPRQARPGGQEGEDQGSGE